MSTLSNLQLPPPKHWQEFENLCCDLWRSIWHDPNAKKNGRQGQPQHGVDVFGQPEQGKWAGVQCKGKDNYADKVLTEKELRAEVKKAKGFIPKLSQFIIATTGPRDAKIQKVARRISASHSNNGLFSVDIWSWEDIVESLASHPDVVKARYPEFALTATLHEGLDQIQATQRESLGQQAKASTELKSHVTSHVERIVASLPDSLSEMLTSYHDKTIDLARDFVKANKPAQALDYLLRQKDLIWSQATPEIKARLLTAIGAAQLGLAKEQKAAEIFLEANQYTPTDPKTVGNAALGHLLLGNSEEARRLAHTLIEANPTNYHARSIAIQVSSDSLEALVNALPEFCRNNRDVAFALAAVARKQGELEQAERWYRLAAAASDDPSPDIMAALGQTILERLFDEKSSPIQAGQINDTLRVRLEEVNQLYTDAWAAVPEESARMPRLAWLINRGTVRRLLGLSEAARTDFQEASGLDPNNWAAKYHAAVQAENDGNAVEALALAQSIGICPELPRLSLFIADLLLELKGPEAAIQHLRHAIDSGLSEPVESVARQLIVVSLLNKREFEEAIRICEPLIKSAPCDVRLLVIASQAHRQQGLSEAADALLLPAR